MEPVLESAKSQITNRQLQPIFFSRQQRLTTGAWLEGERLLYNGELICKRSQIKLRGEHNVSNILAAAAISGAAGATVAAMGEVARSFAGVPHRLEVVTELGGVTWINDSIATAPERAVAALRSFDASQQTLILLAGGKDKNLPWQTFAEEVVAASQFFDRLWSCWRDDCRCCAPTSRRNAAQSTGIRHGAAVGRSGGIGRPLISSRHSGFAFTRRHQL